MEVTNTKKQLIKPSADEEALITAAAMSDPDALPYTDAEWEKVRPLLKRGYKTDSK
jgi:hypothetical protein